LGAWQVAVRYSWADFNSVDIFGGTGESLTLGLNWYWNPYARVQFNYIHGNIEDSSAPGIGGEYDIVGIRYMVDF
ncbi:MAG: porin, partial [Planctomycetota bacterium]|nr:porin [Planctomycetota bacterium]